MEKKNEKGRFLLSNLIKGLIWLALILVIFIVVKKNVGPSLTRWEAYLYENPSLYYTIYVISELLAGIIPPEIFMLLSLDFGGVQSYILNTLLLATISYLAGIIGYGIGAYFNRTVFFRAFKRRYFKKFESQLHQYGSFLVIVAALTPIPFSAVCMFMGSVRLSIKTFLFAASSRFLRFGIYAYFVWQANMF